MTIQQFISAMFEKFKKWGCKHFGHKYDTVETTILAIKLSALNVDELLPLSIACVRCGKVKIVKVEAD